MAESKIISSGPISLVGGGALSAADLDMAVAQAPVLVAADGGADAALTHGHRPDHIIGDLDSLAPGTRAALPGTQILEVADQNSTDFEKCLARIEAPLILAVGFLGKRIDHQLAAFSTLARQPAGRIVLIGAHDVCIHLPPRLSLELAAGTRVSLFPMAPVRGTSAGLEWPIAGLDFAPARTIGTSNRATGPVHLEMAGAGMLLILPRRCFPALLAALAGR